MPQRFKVILLTVLAVFICYIDRVVISLAIIPMGSEMGWSDTERGIVLGMFYFGYIFTQIPGGLLSDRYGAKLVLGIGLIVWSIFTLITPFSFLCRFLLAFISEVWDGSWRSRNLSCLA